MNGFEIPSWAIARIVKPVARPVSPPMRICLTCGVRIGRMTMLAYAACGGLCQGCDPGVVS